MAKIIIKLSDDKKDAHITVIPNWLMKLFGASAKHGHIRYYDYTEPYGTGVKVIKEWQFVTTRRHVGSDIVDALELADVVVDLPVAKANPKL